MILPYPFIVYHQCMKSIIFIVFVCSLSTASAQELFTYTEPASNMASKSIGIRMSNYLMKENASNRINYHLMPEVMVGVSKAFMVHGTSFLSNRSNRLVSEGGMLYMKYRFYSIDEVHSHFRLAAVARASINNTDVHQPAIDLIGHNSGYEAGLIATKLIEKVALSAGSSFLYATDNRKNNKFVYGNNNRTAIGYTLSAGKLLLPKAYTSFRQTNVNAMLEFLGQTNLNTGNSFLDAAPSIQFILLSKMRLDFGYRFPIVNKLSRTADTGFLLRFEYNFFNAFR